MSNNDFNNGLLDQIKKYGIEDIVIAAGFQAKKIHAFFDEEHRDLNVTIVDSGDVDIIERIRKCSSGRLASPLCSSVYLAQ